MINSTYIPKRYDDLNADSCMVDDQGIQGSIPAGTTANIDLKITDDHLITGVQMSANNANFGDSVSLQVVDKDEMLEAIYGSAITAEYPNYPILRQFATNWRINSDTQVKLDKDKLYPAKIIDGLYLRVVYTSTGSTDVDIITNYELHKVLI